MPEGHHSVFVSTAKYLSDRTCQSLVFVWKILSKSRPHIENHLQKFICLFQIFVTFHQSLTFCKFSFLFASFPRLLHEKVFMELTYILWVLSSPFIRNHVSSHTFWKSSSSFARESHLCQNFVSWALYKGLDEWPTPFLIISKIPDICLESPK